MECRCAQYKLCRTADEAVEYADSLGYPAVLRVVSPQIIHKSEVQGIALNLADGDTVRGAFERIEKHLGVPSSQRLKSAACWSAA